MQLDIIIVYSPRYEKGHEMNFVPPVTAIHLAALTPPQHKVRVFHQQVDQIDFETEADLIALSFFSGFAQEAYRLAAAFKQRGKRVVAGGPHATFWPEEVLTHCDAVVIGEAESVWLELLADAERGQLQPQYHGRSDSLDGLPTPRYELLPNRFFIKRVIQATRGCPFTCSFCTVPTINPGFRVRPVADVLRDVAYDDFPHWWQRKVVWFWDDNLTAKRAYIKELLRAMIPYKRWWLTQASIDIVKDEELLDLMEQSGCIGIFIGIETFGTDALKAANKRQNKVAQYKAAIDILHQRGICVMAGFIAGFDGDTPDSIVAMADQLYEIGVDVPFLSVLTPYKGTPLYEQLAQSDRMLTERDWSFYNGYNVTFQPQNLNSAELLTAHRALWRKAFSPRHALKRILRGSRYLRAGAFLMSMTMNSFYGLKRLHGNEPISMERPAGRIRPGLPTAATAGDSYHPY